VGPLYPGSGEESTSCQDCLRSVSCRFPIQPRYRQGSQCGVSESFQREQIGVQGSPISVIEKPLQYPSQERAGALEATPSEGGDKYEIIQAFLFITDYHTDIFTLNLCLS